MNFEMHDEMNVPIILEKFGFSESGNKQEAAMIRSPFVMIPPSCNGECGEEMKKRVQAGWNGWRKTCGVICDRRMPAKTKGKVYKTIVRPAMKYGLETMALTKRQEAELGQSCQGNLG